MPDSAHEYNVDKLQNQLGSDTILHSLSSLDTVKQLRRTDTMARYTVESFKFVGTNFVDCELFAYIYLWGCNFAVASFFSFSKKDDSFLICFRRGCIFVEKEYKYHEN